MDEAAASSQPLCAPRQGKPAAGVKRLRAQQAQAEEVEAAFNDIIQPAPKTPTQVQDEESYTVNAVRMEDADGYMLAECVVTGRTSLMNLWSRESRMLPVNKDYEYELHRGNEGALFLNVNGTSLWCRNILNWTVWIRPSALPKDASVSLVGTPSWTKWSHNDLLLRPRSDLEEEAQQERCQRGNSSRVRDSLQVQRGQPLRRWQVTP